MMLLWILRLLRIKQAHDDRRDVQERNRRDFEVTSAAAKHHRGQFGALPTNDEARQENERFEQKGGKRK